MSQSRTQTRNQAGSIRFSVTDNRHLTPLLGNDDQHLKQIERDMRVSTACRGNHIVLTGEERDTRQAMAALAEMLGHVKLGRRLDGSLMRSIIAANRNAEEPGEELPGMPAIKTRTGSVLPRNQGQKTYAGLMARHEMVFGVGPAGTGKTYLAVAHGVALLQAGRVDRIVLSRPAVEAGERLGFLPGDLKEKVDPYLRPLYDALHDMMPGDQVVRRLGTGEIEIAPLAFMRGRTLAHSFVILDEAQNTTPVQMKMFLTRMGEGTRMVVTGDLTQIDLPRGQASGLAEALDVIAGVPGIGVHRFGNADVVRHEIVARILDAYDGRANPAPG